MNNIAIKVYPMDDTAINFARKDAQELANRLGVVVELVISEKDSEFFWRE